MQTTTTTIQRERAVTLRWVPPVSRKTEPQAAPAPPPEILRTPVFGTGFILEIQLAFAACGVLLWWLG